jgi:beta-alanine--pyruvate transaminase
MSIEIVEQIKRLGDSFLMPFTEGKRYLESPRVLSKAKGFYFWDDKDNKILDGTSGMWCVNAGHSHPKIVNAIKNQLEELDYASCFRIGHPKVFELAAKLRVMAPGDINHCFFVNSGSEAVDSALKIALKYHALNGEPQRKVIIGRDRAYHGVGFGGIAVSGFPKNREHFHVGMNNFDHLPHTHNLEKMAFSRGEPDWGLHLADELETLVKKHGPNNIAAVIVEPVSGSTGVLVPPKGYLKRLREICDQYDILLIFDEVITAFGRLGHPFAANYFDVLPDLITIAKGITSGVIPLGAVLMKEKIYQTIMKNQGDEVEFLSGNTYSGHPVACAAALGALEAYQAESMFDNVKHIAPYFEEQLQILKGLPGVVDIRNIGLMAAVEFESEPGHVGRRAYQVFLKCFEEGLLVRASGETIALSPALSIDEKHIDEMIAILGCVIESMNWEVSK